MAKTRGPLMSIDAAGNYAKGALQFRHGKSGVHAYKPTAPYTRGGQASQAQLDHRNKYSAVHTAWLGLSQQDKDNWNQQAATISETLSGWNLYLQTNINASGESHGNGMYARDFFSGPAGEMTTKDTT